MRRATDARLRFVAFSLAALILGATWPWTAQVDARQPADQQAARPLADLSVAKTDDVDPVEAGTALTYTVTVTNAGPHAATTVTVTDTLPMGVAFVSAHGPGWLCGEAARMVTCTRQTLPVGPAPAIIIAVTVDVGATGSLANNVAVSSTTIDPTPDNDTATEDTTVTRQPRVESPAAAREQGEPRRRRRPSPDSNSSGYIDNAIVGSRVSIGVDAAFGNPAPDRAEFFYAKCGCFRNSDRRRTLGDAFDPDSPGSGNLPETDVDYRAVLFTYEQAYSEGLFSLFVELPYRNVLKRDLGASLSGFSDLRVGAKAALVASANSSLTVQLRTYLPTGEPRVALGTNHATLEPGLLLFQRLTDPLSISAELRYWHPTSGSSAVGLSDNPEDAFSGDIVRFGVGVAADLTTSTGIQLSPVAEAVGWSVLGGFKTLGLDAPVPADSAEGDTIVNLKLGTRIRGGFPGSFYVGYGFALTDESWYDDIFRFEYRVAR